ncbi:unnamed protein product [Effrenium voratum]|nr:unnamed protein product [Effrenium voratum]
MRSSSSRSSTKRKSKKEKKEKRRKKKRKSRSSSRRRTRSCLRSKEPRRAQSPDRERETELVDLMDIRFTHDSIAGRFGDGRTFEALIRDLELGRVDPATSSFLHLEAFCTTKVENRKLYFCLNNRRLYCLKEYGRRSGRSVKVHLKVRALAHDADALVPEITKDQNLQQFLRAMTTDVVGKAVRIRER